ncbi:MAG: mgtE-like transporter [Actinomycetota bacterium]|nr:mgtE-like transporter [Actinomycetota bacterium]
MARHARRTGAGSGASPVPGRTRPSRLRTRRHGRGAPDAPDGATPEPSDPSQVPTGARRDRRPPDHERPARRARGERERERIPTRQLPRQAIKVGAKVGTTVAVPIRRARKVVRPIDLTRRLLALLGPSTDGARQSLVSLCLNSSTSLLAGAVLGSITGTFERLPGLLVLVPAAIGLRGNVFSSLGNRLSTSIHVGTFRLSLRPRTLVGQNVVASLVLTLMLSMLLAVVAKVVAVALGVADTISVFDLALISVVGGLLASLVVLVATIALAAGSVRYDWDLDNVTAPIVSTLGDVLTLPALWVASLLVVDFPRTSDVLGGVVGALAVFGFVLAWRSHQDVLRQVVRESTPILLAATCLSTMAGIAIEKRLDTFSTYPALFILFPAFISSAGALGGILSARLSTKLHLGVMAPTPVPNRDARLDGAMMLLLGLPVYLFNGVGAHYVGRALGQASPGLPQMVAASLLGGALAVGFVVAVAYYGTIAAVRFGVDPDTYGIPLVTSSVDFAGALFLILIIVALGVA